MSDQIDFEFIPEISYHEARSFLWLEGDLSYLLWDQQVPIYDGIHGLSAAVTYAVILCARQYGKSQLCTILATEDCLRIPDCCVPIIGPTAEQTRDIVVPRMEKLKKACPIPGMIHRAKAEDKWYVGSSEIVIGGFDINSGAQRGKTVLGNIYIEEVVDSNPDDFMTSMRSDLGPAMTHSQGGKICFMSTLPKIPHHPFITEIIPQAKLDNAFYSFDINANRKLSRDQYLRCAKLAGCRIENGEITEESVDWQREYLNRVIRDPSVVAIPSFNPSRHVRNVVLPYKRNWEVWLDFGGTTDPSIAILGLYDYMADILLVWDERTFGTNTPTSVITAGVDAMCASWGVEDVRRVADCPGQIRVDLTAAGWTVQHPLKSDWQANVNQLNVRFTQDKCLVHPRCKVTIMTLESGQLNKQRTDFLRTSGVMGHCEAIAALMYGSRSVNMQNPYGDPGTPENMFRRPRANSAMQMAEAIQPKTFGAGFKGEMERKAFGSFKR